MALEKSIAIRKHKLSLTQAVSCFQEGARTPTQKKNYPPKNCMLSTDNTQKPPKKEEAYFQIFLKFSGDRICMPEI